MALLGSSFGILFALLFGSLAQASSHSHCHVALSSIALSSFCDFHYLSVLTLLPILADLMTFMDEC